MSAQAFVLLQMKGYRH